MEILGEVLAVRVRMGGGARLTSELLLSTSISLYLYSGLNDTLQHQIPFPSEDVRMISRSNLAGT